MSRKDGKDEHLPTGAIIYWSRKFRHNGLSYVPVYCPECGRERDTRRAVAQQEDFTGLCRKD